MYLKASNTTQIQEYISYKYEKHRQFSKNKECTWTKTKIFML